MSYATENQFIEAFGRQEAVEVTNLEDPQAEDINSVTLERALEDASEEINAYLQGRYDLPLASNPRALVPVCLNIARYRLDHLRSREDVRKRYEDAIRFLTLVAKGEISLGLDVTNSEVPGETAGDVSYQARDRVFGSALTGF